MLDVRKANSSRLSTCEVDVQFVLGACGFVIGSAGSHLGSCEGLRVLVGILWVLVGNLLKTCGVDSTVVTENNNIFKILHLRLNPISLVEYTTNNSKKERNDNKT